MFNYVVCQKSIGQIGKVCDISDLNLTLKGNVSISVGQMCFKIILMGIPPFTYLIITPLFLLLSRRYNLENSFMENLALVLAFLIFKKESIYWYNLCGSMHSNFNF